MHSLFLALSLLAAGPTAPVAPEPPRFEPPRFEPPPLPPLIAGKPSVEAPTSIETTADQPPHPRDHAADRSSAAPTPAEPSQPRERAKAEPSGPSASQPPHPRAPPPDRYHDQGPPTVLPPSLTPNALRDELRAASQRRQDELAAIARERTRLEKLSTDIATARAALESETARLDDKVKKAEAAKPTGPQPPTTDGQPRGKPSGETLAKTLKGMKPDQAAALVSRLERRLAVNLLRQMRPADAGGVLEKMRPETAAELFALMASSDAGGSR